MGITLHKIMEYPNKYIYVVNINNNGLTTEYYFSSEELKELGKLITKKVD